MENKYKKFLKNKSTNSFWKIAKQLSLHEGAAIEKVQKYLTDEFGSLTTRSSIPLRYLGLIINNGSDNLELSQAGNTFVRLPYKQKILDEQLMKLYLNCGITGNRLRLDIIPLKVLLLLVKDLKYLTFTEYKLFICWINDYSEIDSVISFINDLRKNNSEEKYLSILEEKTAELNINDFADNIKRFFDMLLVSSYFVQDKESGVVNTMLESKEIDTIVNTFDDSNFSEDNYYDYLIHNDGWKTYSDNIEVREILESLKEKTDEERKEIAKQVVKKEVVVTPIEDVKPEEINLKIIENQKTQIKKRGTKKKTPFKIDFAKRDEENRESGDRAEKVVVKYEKDNLVNKSKNSLAEQVEQLSLKDDSLGYDILSFEENGTQKHIEVKGVRSAPNSKFSFYISDSEMQVACSDSLYFLYIVFNYLSEKPMIFKMPSKIFSENVAGVNIIPKKYLIEVSVNKLNQ